MGQMWYTESCPHCNTVNWYYSHRPYDADWSKMDLDPIYKCRNCNKNFIDEEMDLENDGDATLFEYSDLWESVNHDPDKFIEQFEEAEIGREFPKHG